MNRVTHLREKEMPFCPQVSQFGGYIIGHPNDGSHEVNCQTRQSSYLCFGATVDLPELAGFHLPMDHGGPWWTML